MWPLWAVLNRSPYRVEDKQADQETVRRVANGDTAALADLYDRHAHAVLSLAARILGDPGEAEDVVQDTFAQAWRQASRFDPARGSAAAWLLNIARSRAIDRLRARRQRPDVWPLSDENRMLQLPDAAASPESIALTDEQVQRVRAMLERLPFLQRVAIELAYYEGLTQHEIAERLEQPLGTIKTRIRLGLLKLREAIAEAPQA